MFLKTSTNTSKHIVKGLTGITEYWAKWADGITHPYAVKSEQDGKILLEGNRGAAALIIYHKLTGKSFSGNRNPYKPSRWMWIRMSSSGDGKVDSKFYRQSQSIQIKGGKLQGYGSCSCKDCCTQRQNSAGAVPDGPCKHLIALTMLLRDYFLNANETVDMEASIDSLLQSGSLDIRGENFVVGLADFYDKRGFLSKKQRDILKELMKKVRMKWVVNISPLPSQAVSISQSLTGITESWLQKAQRQEIDDPNALDEDMWADPEEGYYPPLGSGNSGWSNPTDFDG